MSDTHPAKDYLGDGVYIQVGRFLGEIVLTTEDGIRATNTIVMGPGEIAGLNRFLERWKHMWEEAPTADED